MTDIGTTHHAGGLAVKRMPEPEESFEDAVSQRQVVRTSVPEAYAIRGSYCPVFLDPQADTRRTL